MFANLHEIRESCSAQLPDELFGKLSFSAYFWNETSGRDGTLSAIKALNY